MRALLLLATVGCHAGIGPVLAYSTSEQRVRVGLEGAGGAAFVRASFGGTMGLSGEAHERPYLTFDPGYPFCNHGLDNGNDCLGPGGSIGLAWNDQGAGLAAGFWGFLLRDIRRGSNCGSDTSADVFVSLAVGYRYLAGVSEVFLTPKINVVSIPCID